MRPFNARKLLAILKKHGFMLSRQKGSHMILKNQAIGVIVPVPLHGRSLPIHIGTLNAIIKQSKIPKEQFEE